MHRERSKEVGHKRTRDCGALAALGVANEADGVGGREGGQCLHGQQDGVAAANAAREHEQHEQGALGREEKGGKEGGSAAGSSRVASGLEISLKRAHVAAANRLHALQVQLVDAAAEAVAARACRGRHTWGHTMARRRAAGADMKRTCRRECSRSDRPCSSAGEGGEPPVQAFQRTNQWQKSLLMTKKFWGSAKNGARAAAPA